MPTGVVVDPNNWVLNKVGSITTGINDPVNVSSEVIVYPNPTKGDLVIKYPVNWFDNITFFDGTGRRVFSEGVERGSAQRSFNRNLQPGVYFLRLDGKSRVAVKKDRCY